MHPALKNIATKDVFVILKLDMFTGILFTSNFELRMLAVHVINSGEYSLTSVRFIFFKRAANSSAETGLPK